jgi:outer membrane immunogenic protein
MLKKLLMASVGVVVFAGSAALADDLRSGASPPIYVPPPFTWTGVYLGGQIGYAWGNDHASVNAFNPGTPGTPGVACSPNTEVCVPIPGTPGIPPLFLSGPFGSSPQGVIGGAHIGYNLQLTQWVIGLEGSVEGTSLSKTIGVGDPFGFAGISDTIRSPIQGSIRGRLGYAWDRVLFYATGGVAFAGVDNTYTASIIAPVSLFLNEKISQTRVGWTVGGGLEYAVTNNWSVRAEYRYSDFGPSWNYPSAVFFPAGGTLTVGHHLTQNQVQVGFSYKFD